MPTLAADLRRRGLTDEAEVAEFMAATEFRPPAPQMPPARITMDDPARSTAGDEGSAAGARGGGAVPVEQDHGGYAGGAGEASACTGQGADQAHESAPVASSGGHGDDQRDSGEAASQVAPANANEAHTPAHSREHDTGIDHADPLAGLYSDRLRTSLEREAFREASVTAQDSAIAERLNGLHERAASFDARASRFEFDKLLYDTSPQAQAARIEALNGEIPGFARGNPSLDPALIRAAERGATDMAPHQSPAQSLDRAPSSSPRSRDTEFER